MKTVLTTEDDVVVISVEHLTTGNRAGNSIGGSAVVDDSTNVRLDVGKSRIDGVGVLPRSVGTCLRVQVNRERNTHVITNPNLFAQEAIGMSTGVAIDLEMACVAHLVAALVGALDTGLLPAPASNGSAERWEDLLNFNERWRDRRRAAWEMEVKEGRKEGTEREMVHLIALLKGDNRVIASFDLVVDLFSGINKVIINVDNTGDRTCKIISRSGKDFGEFTSIDTTSYLGNSRGENQNDRIQNNNETRGYLEKIERAKGVKSRGSGGEMIVEEVVKGRKERNEEEV
ncbi:hypothetical protein N431DRAFT_441136 [Stipitochalara longipes BDJ]|nr:hypothetical protein N431DRAFT_441136 [Stipitochalara longipes BDJ]